MGNPDLSLTHLVRRPTRPVRSAGRPPLLLLLHGVGSNEHDLFGLAPFLDERMLVISARAPNVLGHGSYAWFAVRFAPEGPVIDPAQAEASREQLVRFAGAAAAAYGADESQVYFMGFSQGAIMSASLALTRPESVAGVVMMSGRILPEIRPMIASPERLHDLPFLVVHGTLDTVLPIQHGRESSALLESFAVRLDYREYEMGHEITPASLADAATWLSLHIDEHSQTGELGTNA